MTDRIIVPLDVPSLDAARALLARLGDSVESVKIGKELFTAAGPAAVELAHDCGKRVFLDLKFHDIPNTAAGAVRSAAALGVWMLNVHASGGRAMLEASREALEGFNPRPLLVAVTVLTSLDGAQWSEMYGPSDLAELTGRLARLARGCGLDGAVASPRELSSVREALGPSGLIVTPGVRPAGSAAHDQRRSATPAEAVAGGADYLVIGRPITQSADPAAAAEEIARSLAV